MQHPPSEETSDTCIELCEKIRQALSKEREAYTLLCHLLLRSIHVYSKAYFLPRAICRAFETTLAYCGRWRHLFLSLLALDRGSVRH